MTKTIYLGDERQLVWIRHAMANPDPATPAHAWPLTPEGKEAAARLARSLPELTPPVTLVTSTERKAIETAEQVSKALNLGSPRVSADLREVERPWTEGDYRAAARAYLRSGGAPGWEPRPDVLGRVSRAVAKARSPEGTAVVVGHGLAMSVWAADVLDGIDAVEFWGNLNFPDARLFEEGGTFRRIAG